MAVRKTFESMWFRIEKSVTTHLLLESAYGSNLVPDICKVEYLACNLGRTHLRSHEGLPTFVDDIYVFGYLRREDCVFQKGRFSCTTGEDGAAKLVVAKIGMALQESMGQPQTGPNGATCRQASSTPSRQQKHTKNSTTRATIARIESDTCWKAKKSWEELHLRTAIAGFMVAKSDMSRIER